MKSISYILFFIAGSLALIGMIIYLGNEKKKRDLQLDSLEKARQAKAEKKKIDQDYIDDLEKEINSTENLKSDASTKK